MADAGDNSRALLAAASGQWRRQKWEVDFARYLATPRRAPSTPPPPGLRYISRGKLHCHGTWLPAASPARLCISRPSQPFAAPVLTVSIGDVVYEEHYVSILNFSWPQVACVTQCPIRGSRVVFMSFCDRSKQIQKFAVRFPQLSDAESFLNHVKECSSSTMDIIPSRSNCVLDDSSSEYIASNGALCRPAEAASFEEPTSDHRTDAPALAYHEEPDQPGANIDTSYSSFPHSCSEMLTNCSIDSEKDGEPCEVTATDHAPEKAYMLDTCHDVLFAGKDIDAGKETGDIMARMKTYVATDSFHDMLSKLDKVIDELGGDMSL